MLWSIGGWGWEPEGLEPWPEKGPLPTPHPAPRISKDIRDQDFFFLFIKIIRIARLRGMDPLRIFGLKAFSQVNLCFWTMSLPFLPHTHTSQKSQNIFLHYWLYYVGLYPSNQRWEVWLTYICNLRCGGCFLAIFVQEEVPDGVDKGVSVWGVKCSLIFKVSW